MELILKKMIEGLFACWFKYDLVIKVEFKSQVVKK